MRRTVLLLVALCACHRPVTTPASPPVSLDLQPYLFKSNTGVEVAAELGAFQVPERRADPKSRPITIRFVRFKSTSPNPGPPIVYLAGGPGASGIGAAAGPRFPIFQALRRVGDVIALDQRGTGRSNDIRPCTPAAATTEVFATRDSLIAQFQRELKACLSQWSTQGVAIEGYTTRESADDLDALRRALGVAQINLWGISYGSHLGLAMLKYHGDRVHRAVFAGIEGLDQTVKRPQLFDEMIGRAQQVIDRDTAAARSYPDLAGAMRSVHQRLNATPARIVIPATNSRPAYTLVFDAFALQLIVGGMAADPSGIAQLPALYRAMAAGNMQLPASMLCQQLCAPTTYRGMPEAMDLASGISSARLEMIRREAATALLGDALNFPMPHLAGTVPALDLGDAFRAPLRSSVPTLFISGTLDGRTSPTEAREELRGLSRGTQLIVENGGHNIFEADRAVADAVVGFFAGDRVPPTIRLAPPRFVVR
jgi:pimeloyl-ACP methyl ester carboxylesterase